jgi:Sec-independent protein translocase protein TatA
MEFIPGIGPTEWVIVGIVGLLLFGKQLPPAARNMYKSFAEILKF